MNKQRLHDGRLVVNGKRGQGVPDALQQIITPTVRYGTGDCGLQRKKYRFEKDTRCKGCEGGLSLQEERGANLPFVTHRNSVREHGEWMKARPLAAGRERAMSTGNSEMLLLPFREAYRTIQNSGTPVDSAPPPVLRPLSRWIRFGCSSYALPITTTHSPAPLDDRASRARFRPARPSPSFPLCHDMNRSFPSSSDSSSKRAMRIQQTSTI